MYILRPSGHLQCQYLIVSALADATCRIEPHITALVERGTCGQIVTPSGWSAGAHLSPTEIANPGGKYGSLISDFGTMVNAKELNNMFL